MSIENKDNTTAVLDEDVESTEANVDTAATPQPTQEEVEGFGEGLEELGDAEKTEAGETPDTKESSENVIDEILEKFDEIPMSISTGILNAHETTEHYRTKRIKDGKYTIGRGIYARSDIKKKLMPFLENLKKNNTSISFPIKVSLDIKGSGNETLINYQNGKLSIMQSIEEGQIENGLKETIENLKQLPADIENIIKDAKKVLKKLGSLITFGLDKYEKKMRMADVNRNIGQTKSRLHNILFLIENAPNSDAKTRLQSKINELLEELDKFDLDFSSHISARHYKNTSKPDMAKKIAETISRTEDIFGRITEISKDEDLKELEEFANLVAQDIESMPVIQN